ncbi:MAG: LysR family transcriptional regulator [Proteobacteria bacterium]|nr:LysR family transcriptional regulator [Burkholderiales bacterium]
MKSKAYSTRPRLQLAVSLDTGNAAVVPATAFELLRRLAKVDSLREAANGLGLSYRHAWGLLRSSEEALGAPLVETRRGYGSRLTDYGALLAAALEEIEAQLAPELDAAAQALAVALSMKSSPASRKVLPEGRIASDAETPQGTALVRAWTRNMKTKRSERDAGRVASTSNGTRKRPVGSQP